MDLVAGATTDVTVALAVGSPDWLPGHLFFNGLLGRPGGVASAVLFLVSLLAAYITARILVVDGSQQM